MSMADRFGAQDFQRLNADIGCHRHWLYWLDGGPLELEDKLADQSDSRISAAAYRVPSTPESVICLNISELHVELR